MISTNVQPTEAKPQFAGQLLRRRATGVADGLQIEAPVEPIVILGQVTMGEFTEIEGMIGSHQGGFHVAERGVDSGKTRHVRTAPARIAALSRTAQKQLRQAHARLKLFRVHRQ